MIPTLSINITGIEVIGQGQGTCEKHIIIDNLGMIHHRNVK